MKKKTIAVLMITAILAAAVPAHAQFLKKLGNALEKVANAGKKNDNGGLGRRLGKSIQIGSMTMSAYGDNPGVGFNFGRCYREGGLVVLTFQFPSQTQRDVENVCIRNYGDDETEVFGKGGAKYGIGKIAFGNRESSEGVSDNVRQGGFTNGYLVITGVPASEASLGRVVFRTTGQYPMDAIVHRYSFVLENVAIEPEQTAGVAGGSSMPQGGWKLTSKGVGPIGIGAAVSAIPASVEGLYGKVRRDGTTLYFEFGGEDVMTAETAGGRITQLQVYGRNVGIDVEGRTFRVGGDTDALKALKGVSGNSYDDDAVYEGIHILGHNSEIQNFTVGQ